MSSDSKLVQIVVIRADLDWPPGALTAQGVHAALAVVHETATAPDTISYLNDTKNMTTRVYAAKNVADLEKFMRRCATAEVPAHLWMEQPENEPTAAAAAPVCNEVAKKLHKSLKFF